MILVKDDFSVSVFFGLLGKFATCTQTIHTHRYGLLERILWKFRWNVAWKQVRKYDFLKQNNCFRINTPNLALRFPIPTRPRSKNSQTKKYGVQYQMLNSLLLETVNKGKIFEMCVEFDWCSVGICEFWLQLHSKTAFAFIRTCFPSYSVL